MNYTEYKRQYMKIWRKKNPNYLDDEKHILHQLKINGCAICGYNKCDSALDFHHSNPKNKKYGINLSKMYKKDLADELNKCILLCANCHREITYNYKNFVET